MVIDGCAMFSCNHEFVAYPFGFVCHKCDHQRPELELDGKKALIFFPLPRPHPSQAAWHEGAIASQAYIFALTSPKNK